MNLAALDLNLLVTLEALLAEASVGRAARRVGLSQPAVSHALRRLRGVLGDPLLVRVGPSMQLTPRAHALREPLGRALHEVRGLLQDERFEPGTSQRSFSLMMPDLLIDLIMPQLLARLQAIAPGVRLSVAPWRGAALHEEQARDVDAVITCTRTLLPGFRRQRLYTDRDALALRRGHPLGSRVGAWRGFMQARHVAVVGSGAREDMIDTWLRSKGVERPIGLTVPGYLQALHVVARSDLVAFVPGRLIDALVEPLGLLRVAPPVDPGVDEQYLFHPQRAQTDAGSKWLRGVLVAIGRAL